MVYGLKSGPNGENGICGIIAMEAGAGAAGVVAGTGGGDGGVVGGSGIAVVGAFFLTFIACSRLNIIEAIGTLSYDAWPFFWGIVSAIDLEYSMNHHSQLQQPR
jgi:hypothetical protein